MRSFYLDASALAKRYTPEVGTGLMNHLFSQVTPDRLSVLAVNAAEVVSVLVRKRNAGILHKGRFIQAMLEFEKEVVLLTAVEVLPTDNSLVIAALSLIQTYSINATDALVLRSALDLVVQLRAAGGDLVLVASDRRLLRAAQAEKLATFDPETQDQTFLDSLLSP